jgi:hypothetical protein
MSPQERANDTGNGVNLIGRWHDMAGGTGVVIVESNDLAVVHRWLGRWNSYVNVNLTPVVESRKEDRHSGTPMLSRNARWTSAWVAPSKVITSRSLATPPTKTLSSASIVPIYPLYSSNCSTPPSPAPPGRGEDVADGADRAPPRIAARVRPMKHGRPPPSATRMSYGRP